MLCVNIAVDTMIHLGKPKAKCTGPQTPASDSDPKPSIAPKASVRQPAAMPGAPSSFLLLLVRHLLLVAMHLFLVAFLLLVRPGAPFVASCYY